MPRAETRLSPEPPSRSGRPRASRRLPRRPRPLLDEGVEIPIEVDVGRRRARLQEIGVAIDAALAGLRQDDELVAQIPADRPRVGGHRDRLQPHARERAQVGDEHLVVGAPRRLRADIEGIGILHQELAAAHDAEARAHLVAELPLDVIEVARQIAVRLHPVAEDLRDQLLVGRPVEHFPVMPILEAQHLRAVGVVALALAARGRPTGRWASASRWRPSGPAPRARSARSSSRTRKPSGNHE